MNNIEEVPCVICGLSIPDERLCAIPDTLVCVNCSTVKPLKGRTVYSHKTAPEVVFMDETEFSNLQRLDRRGRKRTTKY